MKLEEAAAAYQWNIEETRRRFSNNEMLLRKFLQKFPSDQTFHKLEEAVKQEDYAAIETAAHTLKGVAGNLGFTALYDQSAALVLAVRQKELEQIEPLFRQIETEYQRVLTAMKQIEW